MLGLVTHADTSSEYLYYSVIICQQPVEYH